MNSFVPGGQRQPQQTMYTTPGFLGPLRRPFLPPLPLEFFTPIPRFPYPTYYRTDPVYYAYRDPVGRLPTCLQTDPENKLPPILAQDEWRGPGVENRSDMDDPSSHQHRPPQNREESVQGGNAGLASGGIGTEGSSSAEWVWDHPHNAPAKLSFHEDSTLQKLIGADPRAVIEDVILRSTKKKLALRKIYKKMRRIFRVLPTSTSDPEVARVWHGTVRGILNNYLRYKRVPRDPYEPRDPNDSDVNDPDSEREGVGENRAELGGYYTIDIEAGMKTRPRNPHPKKRGPRKRDASYDDEQREPNMMAPHDPRPVKKARKEQAHLLIPQTVPLSHMPPTPDARQVIDEQRPFESMRRLAGPSGAGPSQTDTSSMDPSNVSLTHGGRHQVPPHQISNIYAPTARFVARHEHKRTATGEPYLRPYAGDKRKGKARAMPEDEDQS